MTTIAVLDANVLIPKFIGSRVEIGPVAATVGILFWGWLWGVLGLLLAVPLTAFVKIVADSHPSLIHLSNLLAVTPRSPSSRFFSRRKKPSTAKESSAVTVIANTP